MRLTSSRPVANPPVSYLASIDADQPLPVGELLGGDLLAGQLRGVRSHAADSATTVATPDRWARCLAQR
jgi:hypothetical protein